jgi:hypothetical protein
MANSSQVDVAEVLIRSFSKEVPGVGDLARLSLRVLKDKDEKWIAGHLSELVEELQESAYDLYLQHADQAGVKALQTVFTNLLPKGATAEDAVKLVATHYKDIDAFNLSVSQGRRSRAGKAFAVLMEALLERLGIPYTAEVIEAGRTDLMLPSGTYYKKRPMETIVLSLKRTLRERWRQVVTEGRRVNKFFLATIDEGISGEAIKAIGENAIWLVVPKRIRPLYAKVGHVITFEDFIEDHVYPATKLWKKSGLL